MMNENGIRERDYVSKRERLFRNKSEAIEYMEAHRADIREAVAEYEGRDDYGELLEIAADGFLVGCYTYSDDYGYEPVLFACKCALVRVKKHLSEQSALLDVFGEYGVFATREALELWLEGNKRLVHKHIQSFAHGAWEYEDLFQDGWVAAFAACKAYDPSLGVLLSTYVVDCVKNNLISQYRRNTAKSRTAVTVSLDAASSDDAPELSAMINRNMEELDLLRSNSNSTSMEDAVANHEAYLILLRMVERLPEEQKLVMHDYMCNVPQEVTAAKLGMTQGSVSKMFRNIRIELRLAFDNGNYAMLGK